MCEDGLHLKPVIPSNKAEELPADGKELSEIVGIA